MINEKDWQYEPEPNLEPNPCGGYYCSEEHGHIDCGKGSQGAVTEDYLRSLKMGDEEFSARLSELLHERRYGSAAHAVSDEELARLVKELVEKVRPMP